MAIFRRSPITCARILSTEMNATCASCGMICVGRLQHVGPPCGSSYVFPDGRPCAIPLPCVVSAMLCVQAVPEDVFGHCAGCRHHGWPSRRSLRDCGPSLRDCGSYVTTMPRTILENTPRHLQQRTSQQHSLPKSQVRVYRSRTKHLGQRLSFVRKWLTTTLRGDLDLSRSLTGSCGGVCEWLMLLITALGLHV